MTDRLLLAWARVLRFLGYRHHADVVRSKCSSAGCPASTRTFTAGERGRRRDGPVSVAFDKFARALARASERRRDALGPVALARLMRSLQEMRQKDTDFIHACDDYLAEDDAAMVRTIYLFYVLDGWLEYWPFTEMPVWLQRRYWPPALVRRMKSALASG